MFRLSFLTGVIIKIIIPLIRPGILATLVFCFIMAWNEFLIANIFTRKVNNGVVQLARGLELSTNYNGEVTIVVRPEDFYITSENCKEGWIGTVAFKRLLGPTIELEIAVDEVENLLRLSIPRREGENLNVGKQVNVSLTDKKNL